MILLKTYVVQRDEITVHLCMAMVREQTISQCHRKRQCPGVQIYYSEGDPCFELHDTDYKLAQFISTVYCYEYIMHSYLFLNCRRNKLKKLNYCNRAVIYHILEHSPNIARGTLTSLFFHFFIFIGCNKMHDIYRPVT